MMAEILVVDDDQDVAESLSDVLAVEGHDVRIAANGLEGLLCVTSRVPALVLLDVEMPVLSGPDMAEKLRAQDKGVERVPIVLMSGSTRLEQAVRRVGTPYFLAKPFTLDALLALVKRALHERVPPAPAASPGT